MDNGTENEEEDPEGEDENEELETALKILQVVSH
jgi:hypothetical protein